METIIESVKSLLKTTIPDGFTEAVLERLKSFGVTITEDDAFPIAFSINATISTIKTTCNIKEIPEGLFYVAVDMACGEYLDALKNMNKLNIDGIDLTGAIKQIKEGDTAVTFDESASDEAKISAFIHHLLYGRRGELVCFRKIRW